MAERIKLIFNVEAIFEVSSNFKKEILVFPEISLLSSWSLSQKKEKFYHGPSTVMDLVWRTSIICLSQRL